MSETDSFINEVTEEVRRDRLFALMRRYGWIAVLAVVLLVSAAALSEWRKAQADARAQAYGDALSAALTTEDPAARVAALAAIGGSGDAVAISGMMAAAAAQTANDIPAALERLDAVAADPGVDAVYRDLALLKRVIAAGPEMDAPARDAALEKLAIAGAPYRVLAMEQQALVALQAGDLAGALAGLRAVLDEPQVTASQRQRVTQLIVALGGEETENG